ncbi:MAG: O-antigen ligase family protein [Deltaproteobacteria bacterium]|nr:O-antigen ligase family protein [Deltaproteobacteria bacterium]
MSRRGVSCGLGSVNLSAHEAITTRWTVHLLVAFSALIGLVEGPAEVACGLLVVSALATRRPSISTRDWVPLGLGVWVVAGLPGAFTSTARASSEDTLRPLLALAFVAGWTALPLVRPKTLSAMGLAFGLAISINAAYGYLQVGFGELPLDRVFLKNPSSPQIIDPVYWGQRGASGSFYNRLKLAHMGALGLGLSAITAYSCKGRRRLVGILSICVIGPAIALTGARMAIVAAIVALAITLALIASLRVWIGAAVVAVLAVSLVASTRAGRARIERVAEDAEIRHTIHRVAWAVFETSPLVGVGHGRYRAAAEPFRKPEYAREWTVDAHSIPLHALAETGAVGFAGLMLSIIAGLATLVRRVRAGRDEDGDLVVFERFTLFGLLALLGLGVMHFPLHHANVAMAFWFLLAASTVDYRSLAVFANPDRRG